MTFDMDTRDKAFRAFKEWLNSPANGDDSWITMREWLEDELTHGSASDCFYELQEAFLSGYCVAKWEEEQ